jgi:hypothetical protein
MNTKNEISTKELIKAAKNCSHRAIKQAVALGIPYTIRKENNIVRISPDGTEKILKKLPPKITYNGPRIITIK